MPLLSAALMSVSNPESVMISPPVLSVPWLTNVRAANDAGEIGANEPLLA